MYAKAHPFGYVGKKQVETVDHKYENKLRKQTVTQTVKMFTPVYDIQGNLVNYVEWEQKFTRPIQHFGQKIRKGRTLAEMVYESIRM